MTRPVGAPAGRTLAVLGGTGFFGKSFLDAFARGLLAPWGIDRVIAAARRPDALRAAHPELVGRGVEMVALDVGTADASPRADYLVHAANTADAARYAADPLGERAAILAAADNFVALAADRPEMRIVYASSGAVYGRQPADLPLLTEDAPLSDAGGLVDYKRDYAEAKRLAENRIAALGRERGARVSVARCFTFIGPHLPRDRHFAAGDFLAAGLAGRPVVVNARAPVIRSWMHADDLVRWLLTIADAASPDCPVYNVGSDEAVDVADLARRVAQRYGVPVRVPERSDGPVDRYVPSVAKAARELGLAAMDLDAALDATAARLASDPLVRAGDSATAPQA